jgi:hypothetical protein
MYQIKVPYLDECGLVYLAGCGREGSCLRLNPRASDIWRRLVRDGGLQASNETAADDEFLRFLLRSGAVTASEPDA